MLFLMAAPILGIISKRKNTNDEGLLRASKIFYIVGFIILLPETIVGIYITMDGSIVFLPGLYLIFIVVRQLLFGMALFFSWTSEPKEKKHRT